MIKCHTLPKRWYCLHHFNRLLNYFLLKYEQRAAILPNRSNFRKIPLTVQIKAILHPFHSFLNSTAVNLGLVFDKLVRRRLLFLSFFIVYHTLKGHILCYFQHNSFICSAPHTCIILNPSSRSDADWVVVYQLDWCRLC